MNIEQKLAYISNRCVGKEIRISFNEHKTYDRDVLEYLDFKVDEILPEIVHEIDSRNSLVILECCINRIGYCTVYHYDLSGALDNMISIVEKEEEKQ